MAWGTYYRVKWAYRAMRGVEGGQFYGVYAGEQAEGPSFFRPARGGYYTLPHGKLIVEATPLTAREMIDALDLYQHVEILKYGSTYRGTIVGKARTRVCVAFRTRGGKDKEQWLPALEVEPTQLRTAP